MSEMLNSLFVGKKTSDALVCKAKCIGIMIGLAAGAAMGYAAAMCMSPSCDGAKLRKKISSYGCSMMDKMLKCGENKKSDGSDNDSEN